MGIASVVADIGQNLRAADYKPVDVIEFAQAPWGLNLRLFPVQEIILKAHYGIPLDDNPYGIVLTDPVPKDHPAYNEIAVTDPENFDYQYYKHRVRVTDWRGQNIRYMSEADYLRFLFDEGRSNIREVDHERRELILSLGRRGGKCVVGETLVLTDRGLVRMDSLGNPKGPKIQPLDIGVAQEGKAQSRSASFYNGGVRDTVYFKTKCGYRLEGTPNHRVKVMTKEGTVQWRCLADLGVGDFIAIHRSTDLWPAEQVGVRAFHTGPGKWGKAVRFPDQIDDRWGLLLGYLVGDGTWAINTRVSMTVAHDETIEEVKNLYLELLGTYKEYTDKRRTSVRELVFHSYSMREFLHLLGFRYDAKSNTKATPWVILQSPKKVVCAYLQGLFETDGYTDGQDVEFCSASEQLVLETQLLLLNLGVVSRVYAKHNKQYDRDYYYLIIRGLRSRKAFATQIGFRSKKKQLPLLAGLAIDREGGNTETIPCQKEWVKQLLASVPHGTRKEEWKKQDLREVLGNTCKPRSAESMTYPRLEKVLPVALGLEADANTVQHFQDLQALDYFYDPVVGVHPGNAPVYDLSVPEGASFVAAGMTNHNTFLASVVSAYETYRLLLKGDPQAYYGLPQSNNIQIISVATDKDQAGLLYQEVSGHYRSCGFFSPYTANNTLSYARFQTPRDIEKYGRYSDDPTAKATIKVTFRSCIAKGLRGAGNLVVILDEMAHFTDEGQSSADEVYNAVTPSTSAFSPKNPQDHRQPIGPVEGRIVAISSPLGRQGMFYKLFNIGMKGGAASDTMLCIQAPTWEVNPTVPFSEYEKHYRKDPTVFFTEYGAEFTDRSRGWIEKAEDLVACIQPDLRPGSAVPVRRAHFIGIDVGLIHDGTAIAIGHLENTARGAVIAVDLVDQIKAGEGKFRDCERLSLDDIVDWIHALSRQFCISSGVFDQWAGIPFEQALAKKGLKQIQMTHFTDVANSESYKNFKDMMWDNRLVLYDWPISDGKAHCDYILELLELQAEHKTKNIVKVQAPQVEGKHDDRSDALIRMIWLASQHLASPKLIAGVQRGTFTVAGGGKDPRSSRLAFNNPRRTGSSPDRQLHRFRRGFTAGR